MKTEEEVDALAIYLFGDGPQGREQTREIDQRIAEVPGLHRLRLLEDYLDAALERAAARPGWAAPAPAPPLPSANGHAPRDGPDPLGAGRGRASRLVASRYGVGSAAADE